MPTIVRTDPHMDNSSNYRDRRILISTAPTKGVAYSLDLENGRLPLADRSQYQLQYTT